ncbi:MAG TPA: ATP-binding cassette domain-containing protein [Bacteroidales bacterium]|nr:ATP-binding cassette domain-containing protein [Bacteroidales bacterium]
MKIILENIGKQYKNDWIFQHIQSEFNINQSIAIVGPNGSGKSTFINIISGHTIPTSGNISYLLNSKQIKQEEIYQYISVCSPYIELIEEFTIKENINWYVTLKKLKNNLNIYDVINLLSTPKNDTKKLSNYSSGIKQRVKLALSILSDTPILLLDEPCANLDAAGIKWYNDLISMHSLNRIIFISSNNNPSEIAFCSKKFEITSFK